jgi:hypothetical protein
MSSIAPVPARLRGQPSKRKKPPIRKSTNPRTLSKIYARRKQAKYGINPDGSIAATAPRGRQTTRISERSFPTGSEYKYRSVRTNGKTDELQIFHYHKEKFQGPKKDGFEVQERLDITPEYDRGKMAIEFDGDENEITILNNDLGRRTSTFMFLPYRLNVRRPKKVHHQKLENFDQARIELNNARLTREILEEDSRYNPQKPTKANADVVRARREEKEHEDHILRQVATATRNLKNSYNKTQDRQQELRKAYFNKWQTIVQPNPYKGMAQLFKETLSD